MRPRVPLHAYARGMFEAPAALSWSRRLLAALAFGCIITGCSGTTPGVEPDAPRPADAAPSGDAPPTTGLMPGSLTVRWMHGSADCAQNADPELQIHAYNATTYILRQNKCDTFEAPFIYVLIGTQSALALDTGALNRPTVRDAIKQLIGSKPLLVAHSHAHGDHVASDGQFAGQAGVTVVGNSVAAQQTAFGITNWPTTVGARDLGDRPLDIIALPGHEATHIAIYDRQTGLLLTGDSLYPGLLFISDWATYRTSIHRLAQFAATRPIAHILGAHVEMSATPKVVYPYRTVYQPNEHVLQLTAANLAELDAALTQLGPTKPAQSIPHNDFVIDPT